MHPSTLHTAIFKGKDKTSFYFSHTNTLLSYGFICFQLTTLPLQERIQKQLMGFQISCFGIFFQKRSQTNSLFNKKKVFDVCSEMQEYAKKCFDILVRVLLKLIFPSKHTFFSFKNHPFQAFLVLNTKILYMKKKKNVQFLLICPLRTKGGCMANGIYGHVR